MGIVVGPYDEDEVSELQRRIAELEAQLEDQEALVERNALLTDAMERAFKAIEELEAKNLALDKTAADALMDLLRQADEINRLKQDLAKAKANSLKKFVPETDPNKWIIPHDRKPWREDHFIVGDHWDRYDYDKYYYTQAKKKYIDSSA